ncbi:hypothetical protein C8R43DRAFT_1143085 [Mycena crocata]|nr:hypothetical protein C8R43DRAFT_1143085 [Mycena crocata]
MKNSWASPGPGPSLGLASPGWGFGLGLEILKPKPHQAGPKPRLPGRAGPWTSLPGATVLPSLFFSLLSQLHSRCNPIHLSRRKRDLKRDHAQRVFLTSLPSFFETALPSFLERCLPRLLHFAFTRSFSLCHNVAESFTTRRTGAAARPISYAAFQSRRIAIVLLPALV